MKRFWRNVTLVEEGGSHGIALDGRPLRTPGRIPLAVPQAALAEAIAGEWRAVGDTVDPQTMPLTGLANAAIERVAADPMAFAVNLARYGESDLLYYRADEPPALVARQGAAWDPLLDWARARYDIHFETTAGVMHRPQPEPTLLRLREAVIACNAFVLAGLSPIVTVTGSLVAALALVERWSTAEDIWTASRIDEAWQEEQWGTDALAEATTSAHRADFDAAARFLELVRT